MEPKTKRRIGGAGIALVILLVIAGFLPANILAQGHNRESFRETAGPYEISVVAIPSNLSLGRVLIDWKVHPNSYRRHLTENRVNVAPKEVGCGNPES